MDRLIEITLNWCRDQDQIVKPVDTYLRMGQVKQSTLFGGILSIFC